MNTQMNIELPAGVTLECPTGKLIARINQKLATQGQHLCWFRSSRSTRPGDVTIDAGIFPIGVRTTVASNDCIYHLVHWEWTPRVGKTERSRQYQELAEAWNDYTVEPTPVNSPQLLAAIDTAETFESEQEAIEKRGPTVDILPDLPLDRENLWSLHLSRFDDPATEAYGKIVRRFSLPFERGARRHYVQKNVLRGVYDALTRHGFVVSVSLDAAQVLNT